MKKTSIAFTIIITALVTALVVLAVAYFLAKLDKNDTTIHITDPSDNIISDDVSDPATADIDNTTYVLTDSVVNHVHSYDDWVTVKNVTCTENGVEERCCECGDIQTRSVAAIGHTMSDWTTNRQPTCTENGEEVRTCDCGEKETRAIGSLGHAFGEWTIASEATCTTEGTRHQKCKKCLEILRTEAIPVKNHKESNYVVIKEATCTTDGEEQTTCVYCKVVINKKVIPAKGHNYRSEKIAATCEKSGGIRHTCRNCSDSYVEITEEVLEHDLDIAGKCSRCLGDFSVDMTTRISAPVLDSKYGFSYYPSDIYLMFGAELRNLTDKTVKYCWIQLVVYNTVGDVIYTTTKKGTGPVAPGDKLEFNYNFVNNPILTMSADFDTTSSVEISNIKLEYVDGTVECGSYGYSTSTVNRKLYSLY